ncbi:MAG: hypothetical protein ACLR0U_09755 [Enterocloster clostridioformis]
MRKKFIGVMLGQGICERQDLPAVAAREHKHGAAAADTQATEAFAEG